jgi:hypothetical protein
MFLFFTFHAIANYNKKVSRKNFLFSKTKDV